MNAVELLVDGLAAYRLTRLVTADVITQDLRHSVIVDGYRRAYLRAETVAERSDDDVTVCDRWDMVGHDFGPSDRADGETLEDAVARDEAAPKVATLVTCRWCAGVWVAAGVVVARRVAPRLWDPAARGLAIAAVAVLVSRLEDD